MDLEEIRKRLKEDGETLGWPVVAGLVGKGTDEALRQFAMTPGRGLHVTTRAAVEAYLSGVRSPATALDATEAREVLALLQRAVTAQQKLVKRLSDASATTGREKARVTAFQAAKDISASDEGGKNPRQRGAGGE